MKTVAHAVALSIVLLAAGCAEMQWSKPGADAAAIARDQDECRSAALGRAGPPVAGRSGLDARTDGGRPPVMAPTQGSNERFVAEHEEMRRCMLERGYQLKPAS